MFPAISVVVVLRPCWSYPWVMVFPSGYVTWVVLPHPSYSYLISVAVRVGRVEHAGHRPGGRVILVPGGHGRPRPGTS